MTNSLTEKVSAALDALSARDHFVEKTGVRIDSNSRQMLCDLLNAWRSKRRINVKMYLSNLSTYLNHPDQSPLGFLAEMTNALGLGDLGFDETLWDLAKDEIVEQIHTALEGGILSRVLLRPVDDSLFKLYQPITKGIDFSEKYLSFPKLHSYPEISVSAGDPLHTSATMPFDGSLRIIALENGEFIGMNAYLNIPSGRLDLGKHEFGQIKTSVHVARTIVFAFASPHFAFSRWPMHHERSTRLTQGVFLGLVRSFFEMSDNERSSSVQSFVTTMPQVM